MRILALNMQDLFLRLAYPLGPADLADLSEVQWQQLGIDDEPLKPLGKLRGLARVFEELQPDVAVLSEVGGTEALATFNRLFLGDRYEPLLAAGNSNRGIECGFLLRRDGPWRGELTSHRDQTVAFHYPHEIDATGLEVTAMIAAG